MIINDIQINTTIEEIIQELKSQLSANGIELFNTIKQSGNDVMVACPYHKGGMERKPSAGIRKSDGQFHCFACGETHTLQEVISYCFGWNDITGVKGWQWLLKNFAVIDREERKDIDLDCIRSVGNHIPVQLRNGHIDVVEHNFNRQDNRKNQGEIEKEIEKYNYYHPYMQKRKLSFDVISLFEIGYDKDTDCITFPQRDKNGNCNFIARRSVRGKYFNYPEGVDKIVYGIYQLYQYAKFPQEIIICESMLDALYFWSVGKFAVALNGLGTQQQFNELNKLPCRKFILCMDNDSAGRKAAKRIRTKLKNKIVTEYVLPSNRKDANECTSEEIHSLSEVF